MRLKSSQIQIGANVVVELISRLQLIRDMLLPKTPKVRDTNFVTCKSHHFNSVVVVQTF